MAEMSEVQTKANRMGVQREGNIYTHIFPVPGGRNQVGTINGDGDSVTEAVVARIVELTQPVVEKRNGAVNPAGLARGLFSDAAYINAKSDVIGAISQTTGEREEKIRDDLWYQKLLAGAGTMLVAISAVMGGSIQLSGAAINEKLPLLKPAVDFAKQYTGNWHMLEGAWISATSLMSFALLSAPLLIGVLLLVNNRGEFQTGRIIAKERKAQSRVVDKKKALSEAQDRITEQMLAVRRNEPAQESA